MSSVPGMGSSTPFRSSILCPMDPRALLRRDLGYRPSLPSGESKNAFKHKTKRKKTSAFQILAKETSFPADYWLSYNSMLFSGIGS